MKKITAGAICILAVCIAGAFLLKERAKPAMSSMSSKSPVIVIDPGHGGEDGGAVAADGTAESGINLSISLKLRDIFELFGVETRMTRESDISIHSPEAETLKQKKTSDLKNRVAMINDTENAFLVSIHQNIYTSPKYHGAQVFFSADDAFGAETASYVQEYLRRGVDENNSRTAAVISDSVYLMKNVSCSAVLIECGFLSNPEEAEKLKDSAYQLNIASAIGAGIMNCCVCKQGR